MTFFLSKFLWIFLRPINAVLIGLLMIFIISKLGFRKLRATLIGLLSMFVFVTCFTNIPDYALSALEHQYSRVPIDFEPAGIIVLGGGFDSKISTIYNTYELSAAGDRLIAGLELLKRFPKVPLIYSGGSAAIDGKTEPEANSARKMVEALYGNDLPVIYETKARNTWENATLTSQIANEISSDGKWLLVTSAFHMPRSMGCFRKAGMNVVAWPADYRSEYQGNFWLTFKSGKQIIKSQIAIKEAIGLIAYHFLGRLG